MSAPGDSEAESPDRQAENEERLWYIRVAGLSLYGSGVFLLLGSLADPGGSGYVMSRLAFASLVAGWLASRAAAGPASEAE